VIIRSGPSGPDVDVSAPAAVASAAYYHSTSDNNTVDSSTTPLGNYLPIVGSDFAESVASAAWLFEPGSCRLIYQGPSGQKWKVSLTASVEPLVAPVMPGFASSAIDLNGDAIGLQSLTSFSKGDMLIEIATNISVVLHSERIISPAFENSVQPVFAYFNTTPNDIGLGPLTLILEPVN
jgi:hypothetical protein